MKILIERVWKKIIKRAYKILVSENSGSLLRCLVVVVPKQKNIINRLKT